jgi:predicted kinase
MLAKMKEAVQQNRNIVLDATFHKKETRELFIREMEGKGGLFFIEVQADEKVIRERLKKERPYSDADFEVHQLIGKKNEPLQEPHLTLQSTDENIDEMLQKATGYLKRNNDNSTNK